MDGFQKHMVTVTNMAMLMLHLTVVPSFLYTVYDVMLYIIIFLLSCACTYHGRGFMESITIVTWQTIFLILLP